MASFLTGKLTKQKNGRFTKPSFTKKAKNLFGGRKRKFNEGGIGFGILCSEKTYYAFSSAHIFLKLCQNYATF